MNAPDMLNQRKPQLRAFVNSGHDVLTPLLTCLEGPWQLPPGALTPMHTTGRSSMTQTRITCAPPSWGPKITPISLLAHTDASSLTLLFNQQSGLQILSAEAETDGWLWVQPTPGHAIINIGDAMSIFSNQQFKSTRHRVVRRWGEEAQFKRFSVLYFSRPNDDAIMAGIGTEGQHFPRPDERKPVTGVEWGDAKFHAIMKGRGFGQDPNRKEVATMEKSLGTKSHVLAIESLHWSLTLMAVIRRSLIQVIQLKLNAAFSSLHSLSS